MKQPTSNISRLAISRNATGLPMVDTIKGVKVWGRRDIEMHQPKAPAAITSTSTMPLVSAVSTRSGPSCFNSSVRYTTNPRKSAYRHATAAASVGVNMPLNIPPRITTGVISAKKLLRKVRPMARKPAKGLRPMPSRLATNTTITINARPIRMPGMRPAMKSFPIDTSAVTP